MTSPSDYRFATRCVHAGEAPDPSTGAHGVPLYQNVTFGFQTADEIEAMVNGDRPHFYYSPRGNPTVRCLELKLADLEGSEDAVATASGMSAIAATLIHLVGGDDHLIASDDAYELSRTFMDCDLRELGATVSFIDTTDAASVEAAITDQTRAIYTEVVSNPRLKVTDIDALGAIARHHDLPLVVDNTFHSPALVRPLDHGATIVIHSATKYLSGHGHTQGGVICGSREMLRPLRHKVIRLGGAMSPFAAWLLLAGTKTLSLRMDRHSTNGLRVAQLLAGHADVAEVHYPGLPQDAGHAVARRLIGDDEPRYGGMVSFRPRAGAAGVRAFLNALEVGTLAVSLGDCGTLAWPFASTDLIRLSIGIEDPMDLEADIRRGLDRLAALAADA